MFSKIVDNVAFKLQSETVISYFWQFPNHSASAHLRDHTHLSINGRMSDLLLKIIFVARFVVSIHSTRRCSYQRTLRVVFVLLSLWMPVFIVSNDEATHCHLLYC